MFYCNNSFNKYDTMKCWMFQKATNLFWNKTETLCLSKMSPLYVVLISDNIPNFSKWNCRLRNHSAIVKMNSRNFCSEMWDCSNSLRCAEIYFHDLNWRILMIFYVNWLKMPSRFILTKIELSFRDIPYFAFSYKNGCI